jgi:hypothetical protein
MAKADLIPGIEPGDSLLARDHLSTREQFQDSHDVAIDFDGVIHSAASAWTHHSEVNDAPTGGAFESVQSYIKAGLRVILYSCRAKSPEGAQAIKAWLEKYEFPKLEVTSEKPHARIYIDDKGYHFSGDNWPSVEFIRRFRPWNR